MYREISNPLQSRVGILRLVAVLYEGSIEFGRFGERKENRVDISRHHRDAASQKVTMQEEDNCRRLPVSQNSHTPRCTGVNIISTWDVGPKAMDCSVSSCAHGVFNIRDG